MSGWRGSGFRSGDGADIHLIEVRGGVLFYAARFRFVLTHSHLRQRLLGRNLITVFSTVNTPGEKFPPETTRRIDERIAVGRTIASEPIDRRASSSHDATNESAKNKSFSFTPSLQTHCNARSAAGEQRLEDAFAEPDRQMKKEVATTADSGVAQRRLRKNCARFPDRSMAAKLLSKFLETRPDGIREMANDAFAVMSTCRSGMTRRMRRATSAAGSDRRQPPKTQCSSSSSSSA